MPALLITTSGIANAAAVYRTVYTVNSSGGPLVVDSPRHLAYVQSETSDVNNMQVVDTATGVVKATVSGIAPANYVLGVDQSSGTAYALTADGTALAAVDPTSHQITATIPLPSPQALGVYSAGHLVLVSNSAGNAVTLIDGASNTVVGSVAVGSGPDGVGVDDAAGRAYVANFADDTISVLDLATRAVTQTISVGDEPSLVVADATSHRVYVMHQASKAIEEIDGSAGQVNKTLSLPIPPAALAVDKGNGVLFAASADGGPVYAVDEATGSVTTASSDTVDSGVAVDDVSHVTLATNGFHGKLIGIARATTPAAPGAVKATRDVTMSTVTFSVPSNGGSAIQHFTVKATDVTVPARGGQAVVGKGSPLTVRGLTAGDRYTFTVSATNAVGTGPSSAPSNAVVPSPAEANPYSTAVRHNGLIAWADKVGIHVIHPDGAGRRNLVAEYGARHPSWSPDGKWLAYTQLTKSATRQDVTSSAYIGLVSADGKVKRKLIAGFQPSWTASGNIIFHDLAGIRRTSSGTFGRLRVVNVHSGAVTALSIPAMETSDHLALDSHQDYRLSPNHKVLSWSVGIREYHVINLDGTNHRVFTIPNSLAYYNAPPDWTTDGRLAFGCAGDGNGADECALDPRNGKIVDLTAHHNQYSTFFAGPSPDRRLMVYGGYDALYVADLAGGHFKLLAKITSQSATPTHPDWQPVQ